MVYLISKEGQDLIGFELILADVSGTLSKIREFLKKYYLDIYYLEIYKMTDKDYVLFLAIDFYEARFSPRFILEKLRKEEYVIDASIAPKFKNVIYPSKYYCKYLGDIRVILLGIANMKGIVDGIKRELGKRAGEVFLYHLGYGAGREVYNTYAVPLNIKKIDEAITLLKALMRGAGWGDLVDFEVEEDRIILRLVDYWECEVQKDSTYTPGGHYMKGLLTGFTKALLDREPVVEETKCIALGDPYCQFEIRLPGVGIGSKLLRT